MPGHTPASRLPLPRGDRPLVRSTAVTTTMFFRQVGAFQVVNWFHCLGFQGPAQPSAYHVAEKPHHLSIFVDQDGRLPVVLALLWLKKCIQPCSRTWHHPTSTLPLVDPARFHMFRDCRPTRSVSGAHGDKLSPMAGTWDHQIKRSTVVAGGEEKVAFNVSQGAASILIEQRCAFIDGVAIAELGFLELF